MDENVLYLLNLEYRVTADCQVIQPTGSPPVSSFRMDGIMAAQIVANSRTNVGR
jgi:hypothetical protein